MIERLGLTSLIRIVYNFSFVSLQEYVLGLTNRCRFFINDSEV